MMKTDSKWFIWTFVKVVLMTTKVFTALCTQSLKACQHKLWNLQSVWFQEKISGAAQGVEVSLEWDAGVQRTLQNPQLNDFKELLKKISIMMKGAQRNMWNKKMIPVLMFDEANALERIAKDAEGTRALQDLFSWMVALTKQDLICHIVLGSSDAFFLDWIDQHVGDRQTAIVIGDLDREHSLKFFEKERRTSHKASR